MRGRAAAAGAVSAIGVIGVDIIIVAAEAVTVAAAGVRAGGEIVTIAVAAVGVRAGREIFTVAVAAGARVGKDIVWVVAVEGAREGEGIIVVAVKGAQVGEGILVVAEKGVRVGEWTANIVTAAAAAAAAATAAVRVKASRPAPHVGMPVAPLSSMIATPVTVIITGINFRRSKSEMYPLSFALSTAEIVLVVSLTLVTNPPSLFPMIN